MVDGGAAKPRIYLGNLKSGTSPSSVTTAGFRSFGKRLRDQSSRLMIPVFPGCQIVAGL